MTGNFSRNTPLNVVVTGVGAIIGQGIVKSLRRSRHPLRVVGIDRNAHSLGPHLCDIFYVKPTCDESDPEYLDFWQDVLVKESIDLVFSGIEVDMFFLNAQRQSLGATGASLVLNTPELIGLAQDKWLLGLELSAAGLVPIPTVLSDNWAECVKALGMPPFLMKPRQGEGSRGIVQLDDETDLRYWSHRSDDNFMIQKIIGHDDEEYTVGAFGFGDGNSLPPIVFRRRLSAAGNTEYAEVVSDSSIEQATRKLSSYFKPIGPTNYQFRVDNGVPYLLEINPRVSSSTSLRASFGYNEVEMSLGFYLDGIRPSLPEVLQGRGWRYSEDFLLK